jgi:Flp pilus assembly protein TadG
MAAMIRRRLMRARDDRGAELIEMAIVLPILLLVFAAIVDFGFLFQRYEVVTNAAREGARMATLPNYTVADVQARVSDYLASSGLTDAPTTAVTFADVSVGGAGGPVVNMATVTVDYPSQFLYIGPMAALIGGTNWGTITLRSRSVMRVEAPAGGGS